MNANELNDPTALVSGCDDPEVARDRAEQMIGEHPPASDAAEWYWNAQAERVLAALLHAAALDGRNAYDLAAWLIDPDEAREQVEAALEHVQDPALFGDGSQFLATNPRTRKSLCLTILTAQARATLAATVVNAR